jgi:uncharacterized protein YecE (DUF72 family)
MAAAIRIGTSGFSYKEWKPGFYPKEVPEKQFLAFYAQHFTAVEIDGTFYRMPSASTLESWKATTPDSFRFTLKASQKITHWSRLKLPNDSVDFWLKTIPALGERLGMVLYQLPPNMKLDVERLALFLDHVVPVGGDANLPTAFEFRHEGWFCDEVYALLERHGVALCINDGDEGCTPIRTTAERTYVRLRRGEYSPELRAEWQQRMREWAEAGIEVYGFIKHEDNPDAPAIAEEFAAGLGG